MRIRTENSWREGAIFISIVLMIGGLFISRAVLSISMFFFAAATLLHPHFGAQLKSFLHNRLLLCMSLLFFIPFVSGLWSTDGREWSEIVRIKVPLLLFPLCFAGQWKLSEKQWGALLLFFMVLIFGGSCWSLVQYARDMAGFHEGYLRSKVITTPMEDDHVRFSWLVTVAIICCFFIVHHTGQRLLKLSAMLGAVFFIAYLHILSARTGLFSLYIFLLLYAFWLLLQKSGRGSVFFFGLLAALPLLAWLTLPTFQNRVRYFLYDMAQVRANHYLPGFNDGARMASLQAGWDVLKQHPFGVGAGDLRGAMDAWYAAFLPTMPDTEKFLPCNEWLMYGGFAGWPGVLLFTLIMVVPFLIKGLRRNIYWISLNAIALFSFVFDMGIEAQFGVFIYTCVILCWWKWIKERAGSGQ